MKQVRVVFMGSPAFSVPILSALYAHTTVVGVVTQPDRPKGRGRKLVAPPIKSQAITLGLPVIQPVRLRKDGEALQQLRDWKADLFVVAAYGQILPQMVLDIPRHGCINVHTSLLPRWRGASPIQHAIVHGDKETGVTIMLMDAGMDTGPILTQEKMEIKPRTTYGELEMDLAQLGAETLIATIPGYLNGSILPVPQSEEGVTKASLLKKEAGQLDFSKAAVDLENQVHGYNPWPSAYLADNYMKVHRAHALVDDEKHLEVGIHGERDGFPAIRCSDGWLILDEVQPPGKKAMAGDVFMRGYHDKWLADS
jgi:methionyl-tRNA formyltransferase